MRTNFTGLLLARDHWEQMENDVRAKAPEEACGFVAGKDDRSMLVIPVTNSLHSRVRFRMEPKEQLTAFTLVEERQLDILAIYHSHPEGINRPSRTDYDELTFPGIIYLIWFEEHGRWDCKGYLMMGSEEADEVPLILCDRLDE
jgi:proteasome lid subunit RPN8/RPN11